jgi:threonine dehydrogenase-like Zn-dependent dehydrogenase
VFEASGAAALVFEGMAALGKNGVLVLASVTGGNQKVEVPAARINLEFVLGNKVMVGTVNGNREYFEAAIRDLAMAQAQFPGWAERLLTHPVHGLDNFQQLIETLTSGRDVIKAFCEIAPLDAPAGVATSNQFVSASSAN